ncbi:transglutaminase-like domain-containing protein [Candidatus Laterigemmans baculatus]|uniref:transglutaminase-like domain-containing protein n=1 Tax=Candidatus Laterigemmans baculatus TaxID=2770505 RepID=UPI0013DA38FC|nr:transglutaminase-like domain-containing protein [Candidatus Laterigemmans baculatus]
MSQNCRDHSLLSDPTTGAQPTSGNARPTPLDRRRWLRILAAGGIASLGWGGRGWNGLAVADDEGAPDEVADQAESPEGAEGASDPALLEYRDPKVQRYRCGLVLETGSANCRGIVSTFPIPREWPEQQVKLVEQSVDPVFASSLQVRELDGLVSQVVMRAGGVPAGSTAEATFTFELTRSRIVAPPSVAGLSAPRRPGRELRQYLISSPYIDPGSARIRVAVREIEAVLAESQTREAAVDSQDWKRIETIYDWVREKVAYVEGDIKTADEALKDGTGDCEELTSVFVAICRAMRIPARMVHVLMHCYPEFYLEDADGQGHWFPCQVAGTRQFGSMEEYRPILQKGDRFKTPEQSLQRYVAEYFRAAAVQGGKPKPRFVQEILE